MKSRLHQFVILGIVGLLIISSSNINWGKEPFQHSLATPRLHEACAFHDHCRCIDRPLPSAELSSALLPDPLGEYDEGKVLGRILELEGPRIATMLSIIRSPLQDRIIRDLVLIVQLIFHDAIYLNCIVLAYKISPARATQHSDGSWPIDMCHFRMYLKPSRGVIGHALDVRLSKIDTIQPNLFRPVRACILLH